MIRPWVFACAAIVSTMACSSNDSSGTGCESDADCDAGSVCLGGVCVEVCNTTADCTDPVDICVDQVCVEADNPECRSDGECDSPAVCETEGRCRGAVCVYAPASAGTACDDGQACTTGDVCDGARLCAGSAMVCDEPDPGYCEDEDTYISYASSGYCDEALADCVYPSSEIPCTNCETNCGPVCDGVECPASNGGCTLGVCTPGADPLCQPSPVADDTRCDFEAPGDGYCVSGACEECNDGAHCADGDICTDDVCDQNNTCSNPCSCLDSMPTPTEIAHADSNKRVIAFAWADDRYGILRKDPGDWTDGQDRWYFLWRSITGDTLGTDVDLPTTIASNAASMVWTGSELGVAGQYGDDNGSSVRFQRLGEDGAPRGPSQTLFSATTYTGDVALAWNPIDREYAVIWLHSYNDAMRGTTRDIYFQRVAENGTPIGVPANLTLDMERTAHAVDIVFNGSEYGIAFLKSVYDGDFFHETYFTRVSRTGERQGGLTRISNGRAAASPVHLAWNQDAGEFAMAWLDTRETGDQFDKEIFVTRLSADGIEQGDELRARALGTDTTGNPYDIVRLVDLVPVGNATVLVWQEQSSELVNLQTAQFDDQGVVGDPVALDITTHAVDTSPAVAWNGCELGLVWGAHNGTYIGPNAMPTYRTDLYMGTVVPE